jgi:hypothetical protein
LSLRKPCLLIPPHLQLETLDRSIQNTINILAEGAEDDDTMISLHPAKEIPQQVRKASAAASATSPVAETTLNPSTAKATAAFLWPPAATAPAANSGCSKTMEATLIALAEEGR